MFNDERPAKQWLDRTHSETGDLADRHHVIVPLNHESTGGQVYIAVLMAHNLVAKDHIDDQGLVRWN